MSDLSKAIEDSLVQNGMNPLQAMVMADELSMASPDQEVYFVRNIDIYYYYEASEQVKVIEDRSVELSYFNSLELEWYDPSRPIGETNRTTPCALLRVVRGNKEYLTGSYVVTHLELWENSPTSIDHTVTWLI